MTHQIIESKIEPKENFRFEIAEYFNKISNNQIQMKLLDEIIDVVTDLIYYDYDRFWHKYPKSRKRYSKLKIEDIEHRFVQYILTDFLINKRLSDYREISKLIFNMNDNEFDEYEKNKYLFDTK